MRWMIIGIVLISSSTGLATEKTHSDPRLVIEAYVAAALAGKVDDAVSLGLEGRQASDKTQVLELNEMIDAPTINVQIVWAGVKNGLAIAVTEQVTVTEADLGEPVTGYLVFSLKNLEDKWLVDDLDFDTEEKSNKQVEEFRKENLDAEFLPLAVRRPNADANKEAVDIWVRVTGGNIQIATTPEVAKAMQEGGESAGGMLVNCVLPASLPEVIF